MAQPIICDVCGQQPGAWLIGHLETGNQKAICVEDFTVWMLAMLNEGLSPEEKAALAAEWAPQEGQPAAEDQPAPRPRKRRQKAAALEIVPPEPDSRLAETAPTPDHG